MGSALHIEPFSGVAGDMMVAALLDLGIVSFDELRGALATLPLKEKWSVELSTVERRSIAAKLFSVEVAGNGGHAHRSLGEIENIVSAAAGVPERARNRALAVFERLAEAEAAVHGKNIDAVHFHEVGAADAVVDIVSAAFLLDGMGAERITSSAVALGSGSVATAHGTLPVPVPATMRLLEGLPTFPSGIPMELATPTGAALLAEFVDEWGAAPAGRVEKAGYGAGARVVEGIEPSLLRVSLIDAEDASSLGSVESIATLECWIDDMTGEALAEFARDALDAGALDVALIPATMKKGRPGTVLKLLCAPERAADLADLVLGSTTSLGVRITRSERAVLDRGERVADTDAGRVAVKTALDKSGRALREKPEHDDIERLAAENGLSRSETRRLVEKALRGE
jgi:uncharacterized protein (TIGR00299 family) protein